MKAELHRSDVQEQLELIWAGVERIRDATDPAERARLASDAHSALGRAIDHVNGLLQALDLPAIEVTAGSAEGIS
jgi:hypothetical protein